MGCVASSSSYSTTINSPANNSNDNNNNNNPFLYYNGLKGIDDPKQVNKQRCCLLLIDPQNDFVLPNGSLCVPGAMEDCNRIKSALQKHVQHVDEVFVTLDTHEKYHIAHSMFWTNASKEHPKPLTTITLEDVTHRIWFPSNPSHQQWGLEYVKSLSKHNGGAGDEGKFQLTIWPEHCLIGSNGHAVYEPLLMALHEWEVVHNSSINFIIKGNNAFTEHYSALKAEVVMSEDPRTRLNVELIQRLSQYQKIIIAGQALSHCVNFTVRDLVANIPKNIVERIHVISDGCSPVAGFENVSKQFVQDMKRMGVKFVPSTEAF